jgi:hypothetical protein
MTYVSILVRQQNNLCAPEVRDGELELTRRREREYGANADIWRELELVIVVRHWIVKVLGAQRGGSAHVSRLDGRNLEVRCNLAGGE